MDIKAIKYEKLSYEFMSYDIGTWTSTGDEETKKVHIGKLFSTVDITKWNLIRNLVHN